METTSVSYIKAPVPADQGQRRIEWALQEMPVLSGLTERFDAYRPLDGIRISDCLHITTETANLARALKVAGADLALCAIYLTSREQKLDKRVYDVPADIDQEVASLKLAAMKIAIDGLMAEQRNYLSSWEEGT